MKLRDQVEALLVDARISPGSVNRTMLLIELTVEQNHGQAFPRHNGLQPEQLRLEK